MKIHSFCFMSLLPILIGTAACSRPPEERKKEAVRKGEMHLQAGDYSRAVLEFKNAAQAAPKDADVHYQLGLALVASGDLNNGYLVLRRATELNPSHVGAQLRFAELAASTRDRGLLADAAQRIQKLLVSGPENPEALTILAYVQIQLGELTDAERHLTRALENSPGNLKAAVELARMRVAHGKPGEAESLLRRLAEQKPPSAMAHILLGQFYVATGRTEDAGREMRRALDIDARNITALLYLGMLHARAGETADADKMYKRAAELPDKRNRSVYGAYLLQSGRREEALRELEQLTATDISDRVSRRYLVAAYLMLGRRGDAEKVLDKALKTNQRDVDALLQRSEMLVDSGRLGEAQNGVAKVLKSEPNSAEAHYVLARVHAGRGDVNSQKQELAEAIRLEPQLVRARVEYGRLLTASGAANSALQVLNETPDWQKSNPSVLAERNWALAALGKIDEMRKSVEYALATERTPDLMLQSAIVKMNSGKAAASRSALQDLLAEYPEDTRAIDLLGQSYMAEGNSKAAVQIVRQHAAAHPGSARVQHQFGMWLQRTGASAEAREAFRAAKSADPSLWVADLSLATLNLSEKNVAGARDLLSPLLDYPQVGLQARLLLASAELLDNNFPGAIEQYRKILETQPDNIIVLNNLAYVLSENANRADEALKFAERAKELAPDNPTIDDTLGWILYRKGLHSRAQQYLESSINKQPNASRHAHLAAVYAAQGDVKRGTDQLAAAIRLGGLSTEVQAAQRALAATQ